MSELIWPEESYAIIGACFDVYNDKGCGFLEPVYQECLEIELDHQKIPFVSQPHLALSYRGRTLGHTYDPDFVCYDKIVLEIKAVKCLTDEHRAQVLNYLNATGHKLGLLVNFGGYPKLEYERIVLTRKGNRPLITRMDPAGSGAGADEDGGPPAADGIGTRSVNRIPIRDD